VKLTVLKECLALSCVFRGAQLTRGIPMKQDIEQKAASKNTKRKEQTVRSAQAEVELQGG
jgi:hypothetical protein